MREYIVKVYQKPTEYTVLAHNPSQAERKALQLFADNQMAISKVEAVMPEREEDE